MSVLWRQRSRWTVLIAACWVEATAGLTYVFSTYSSSLKSQLGYDQRHINRLSVAKDLGDTVGLIAGFLCKVLPNWTSLLLGALFIFVGYGLLWLLTDHRIPILPFWLVCILMFVGTNGCTFLDTAALVACIPNFPSNRGTVVGLLKGFKGLCGAIINQIYASFLAPDEISFILLMALGPALVIVPCMLLMGPVSASDHHTNTVYDEDDSLFKILYGISLLLAGYMLTVTLIQDLSIVSTVANVVVTVLLFFILLLPLLVPKIADYLHAKHKRGDHGLKEPLTVSPKEPEMAASPTLKAGEGTSKIVPLGVDATLGRAFSSLEFWLLFSAVFFSLGSGTTAFNNLSQMGQAQGYENTQVFVSMTNIWNFAGRLVGGYASEISTRRYGYPRTVPLAMFQLLMVIGHLLFAVAWPGTIYVAIFLVAMGYGAHWGIFPTVLSELFGMQHFGVLYNFMTMASPAGSLIYAGLIAGPVYDWQARKQSGTASDDTALVCQGTVCFEITFSLMAGFCMIGAILSTLLAVRTRPLYRKHH